MDLIDYWLTTRFGLYVPQLIEESAGFQFGMLVARPSVFEEMRMPYEAIPILIFLTISLLSGVGLIGVCTDAEVFQLPCRLPESAQ